MIIYERMFESSDVQVVCCQVRQNLEQFLTSEESYSMSACASEVRNRAAAARLAARELLSQAGFPEWNLPRKHGDAPDWPPGLTGSLSHSDEFAAAALARCEDIASIGIDIEPAKPLPLELRDTVIVPGDVGLNEASDIAGRILFCAKEASYKAVYPVDRRFLEFADVTVNLDAGFAETNYGRHLSLSVHVDHRIVVLAHLAKDGH